MYRSDSFFLYAPDDGSGSGSGDGGDTGDGSGTLDPGAQAGEVDTQEVSTDSELKRARSEAAKYRKDLRATQKRVEELEGASQTETEKLQTSVQKKDEEISSLVMENRSLRVQVIGAKVGIDPDAREDAARLLDWNNIEDASDSKSIEKALRDLAKEKPYLLGRTPGAADGGAGGTRGEEKHDVNAMIRQKAGRAAA